MTRNTKRSHLDKHHSIVGLAESEHDEAAPALQGGAPKATMPALPITELIWFNYALLPAGNVNVQHLHTFFQLDVVLEGEVEYWTEEGNHRRLCAGQAVLVPPLMRHGAFCRNSYRHISLKMFVAAQFNKRVGWRSLVFCPNPIWVQGLEEACRHYGTSGELASEKIVAASTLVLLDGLERLDFEEEAPSLPDDEFRRIVLPILQPVDEDPTANWSVGLMAERCNLSVDYFSRRFRDTFHYTPHEYLLQARMRWAAGRLLQSPAIPIKKISAQLGYSSVQTFTRAFKSAIGVTPAHYRASPNLSGVLTTYR